MSKLLGALGTIGNAVVSGLKNSTSNNNTSSNSTASNSSSSTPVNTGYGSGVGYGNREVAFTWNDGTTTYSNATRWEDAAKEAGKQGVGLANSVSYMSSGQQKANGNNSIYSNNSQTGNNYTNALTYEQMVANNYDLGNGTVQGSQGYGYGYTDPAMYQNGNYNISDFVVGGHAPYGSAGYANNLLANNPYPDFLKEVQGRYDSQEARIAAVNAASVKQGVDRLEANRTGIQDMYTDANRQAYVAMMLQNKYLVGQLEADGLNGGATETGRLNIANTYMNNLNANNNGLNKEMANLNNAIVDLRNTGDLQTQQQILANSQAALDAYSALRQSQIGYDYTLNRDAISDQRYNQEYQNSLNQQKYSQAMNLLQMGFSTTDTAKSLGISEADLNSYINNFNQSRDLELQSQQLAYQQALKAYNTPASVGRSIKDPVTPPMPQEPAIYSVIDANLGKMETNNGLMHNAKYLIDNGVISRDEYNSWAMARGKITI